MTGTLSRKCTICVHGKRDEIDRVLVSDGMSFRDIARQFGTTASALHRHKRHISRRLVQAKNAHEVSQADSLLDQVKGLQDKAMDILGKAEASGDLRVALQAVREAKNCIELLGKLQGELVLRHATIGMVAARPAWHLRDLSMEEVIYLERIAEKVIILGQGTNAITQSEAIDVER